MPDWENCPINTTARAWTTFTRTLECHFAGNQSENVSFKNLARRTPPLISCSSTTSAPCERYFFERTGIFSMSFESTVAPSL